MKRLNLKKLAVVGTGLALLAGSVFAGTGNVQKSQVLDDANRKLLVSGIVVSPDAFNADAYQHNDYLAAQDLVSALSELAVYTPEATTTTTEQCSTDNTSTEESASNESVSMKKYDNSPLGEDIVQTVTYTSLDTLTYDSSMSYKVGNTTEDTSLKETLGFKVTPSFDTSNNVQRLNLEASSGDLNYEVSFGSSGIDFNADGGLSTSGENTWTDRGSKDNVKITLLGKTYTVHKVKFDSNKKPTELTLLSTSGNNTYEVGSVIDGLEGEDGKTYKLRVDGVTSSSNGNNTTYEAVLTLLDAETGEPVTDYSGEKVSEGSTFAEDVLKGLVQVVSVDNYNPGSNDPLWKVELAVGNDSIIVKHNKGFPYNSSKTSLNDYDWKATLSGSNYKLTSISLTNTSRYDFKNEDGLAPGESLSFPGDLASLQFVGLQLPEFNPTNPRDVFTYEFGTEVNGGSGMGIKYVDKSEVEHEIPFYYEFTVDNTDSDDDANYFVSSFEFDGRTYSLKAKFNSDLTVLDVNLFEGEYSENADDDLNGTTVDHNVSSLNDANISTIPLHLKDSESNTIDYNVAVLFDGNTVSNIWLLFAEDSVTTKTGSFGIVGTDVDEDGTIDANGYFAPADNGDFETAFNKLGMADDKAALALFHMDYNGDSSLSSSTADLNLVIDTETQKAVAYGAGSASNNKIPGWGYQAQDTFNGSSLKIEKGKTNGMEMFYSNYGTKVSVDDSDMLTVVVPREQANVEIRVLAGTVPSTPQQCNNVSTTTTPEPVAYAGAENLSADSFIMSADSVDVSSGSFVIVGGYMVNPAFPDSLKDMLQEEGDWVLDTVNDDIVAAGWTADDTKTAVNALIDILQSTEATPAPTETPAENAGETTEGSAEASADTSGEATPADTTADNSGSEDNTSQ